MNCLRCLLAFTVGKTEIGEFKICLNNVERFVKDKKNHNAVRRKQFILSKVKNRQVNGFQFVILALTPFLCHEKLQNMYFCLSPVVPEFFQLCWTPNETPGW